ncbi:MAG TPA: protein kinase, partial [Kofleriaceae bacterium]|nr:protein kinase [Kofleriaceae bacterium]
PGGEPFYAMPLVSGRSLDKVVAEKKTLNDRLGLLPNVIAVADALAYAHNSNVIHRDLKPANVLVGEFGETVVIDWGLAKDLGVYTDPKESLQMRLRATAEETMSGSVVGTPTYMPPEQARGDAVDQRADVYALGALLYKVLSGVAPYTGESALGVLEAVKDGPPVPVQEREPEAPPDLVAIVAKAMARNPDDRYITASELAQDLKRFETGQLVGAHRYTTGELMRRWLRRHRVAVAISAVALITLIVVGVFSLQRIVAAKKDADAAKVDAEHQRDHAIAGRVNLLEERARTLLDKNAGHALAYLVGAAEVETQRIPGAQLSNRARGFMIADAIAPFEAELAHIDVATGNVVVATSPNGKWVAAAGNGPIRLLDHTGKLTKSLGAFGTTRVVAFDAASTRLVAAGDDGIVRIWSLEHEPIDTRPIAELRGHTGAVNDAVFNNDGKLLATGGDDKSVRIWNLEAHTSKPVVCHGLPVVSVRFSPTAPKVLSASADFSACVIAFRDAGPYPWIIERQIRGHDARVNSAEWSSDGKFIVTASDDGTARVWSEARGKPVYRDTLSHEPGALVKRALVTRSGSIISAGSDLAIRIWELPSTVPKDGTTPPRVKPPKQLEGHTGQIVAAALSADEHYLATGGFDGLVKIWDLGSRQQVAMFEPGAVVTSLAFIPGDPSRVVTGSADGKARIWNASVGERSLDLGAAVRAIAVGPNGKVVAGLGDSLVRVVERGATTDTVDLHRQLGAVNAVAFVANDKLITAGEDPAVFVWDLDPKAPKQLLGTFAETKLDPPPPIRAVARVPSNDGDRVALVRAGRIELWRLANDLSKSGLVGTLAPEHGAIDTIAVSAQGMIVGVGQDGTFAVWDKTGSQLAASGKHDPSYNAVAFAPDGSALVAAGPGFARVFDVTSKGIGDVAITLDPSEDIGVVRTVLFAAEGALVITAGDRGRALIWDRQKGKLLARRDRHDAAINALGMDGEILWVASEDQTLRAWKVHVDTRTLEELQDFMIDHVAWTLKDDVVVRVEDATGKQGP